MRPFIHSPDARILLEWKCYQATTGNMVELAVLLKQAMHVSQHIGITLTQHVTTGTRTFVPSVKSSSLSQLPYKGDFSMITVVPLMLSHNRGIKAPPLTLFCCGQVQAELPPISGPIGGPQVSPNNSLGAAQCPGPPGAL